MRVGILTPVRLLGEAIGLSLTARGLDVQVALARHLDELRVLARGRPPLDLVIVDTTQRIDLDAIRSFHRELMELPLLALGLREREAEVVAHGTAGFIAYLRREDGLDRLCAIIDDALAGRLSCSPEIAAAIMRGLFRTGPTVAPAAPSPLTAREEEVAQLVSRALSNKEIARALDLSESTVKHHVHSILAKLGVGTRGQLMRAMRADMWGEAPRAGRAG